MKIVAKAIDGFLQAPARESRACLLYGPDGGLVRERGKRIAKALLGALADDPFAKTELSEAELLADPAKLADELGAVSMMAPKRVLMIRGGDKLTGIIDDAKAALHKDCYLIVLGDDLASRSSLRAWFEKEPQAAAIACYKDEVRDVQQVVRERLEGAGIRAPRDVLDYLVGQLGNDRYVTYQELDKIITYAGEEKTLTLAQAQELVDYNRDTNLDDMVNAVANRNLAALDKTVNQLLREGTQPVAYLRALQRYFNRLYYIRAQAAQGISIEQVIEGLRPPVFFKQKPLLTRHAIEWSTTAIHKALKLLIEAELACKSSDIPAVAVSNRKLLQITQLR
jgi:DNA polymerase III subunit delta